MSTKEKTLDELYQELKRVQKEQDAKGRNHPDHPLGEVMIKSIRKSIDRKKSKNN
jgi:hypothetical protein